MKCLILILCCLATNAWAEKSAIYAQLSSDQTQVIGLEKSKHILINSDEINGVELNQTKDSIKIKESGIYYIMAAGQVGTREKQNETGYVDLWLLKNGKIIANSNTRQATGPHFTTVLASQYVTYLKAEDSISFGFSATRPSLGLIATKPDNSEPAIPSIIISVFKIN